MIYSKLQEPTFKAPKEIAADDILLLSFNGNKAWFFMWILCPAEDSPEISSLIFSEKQWKIIYKCRLLKSSTHLEATADLYIELTIIHILIKMVRNLISTRAFVPILIFVSCVYIYVCIEKFQ